MAQKDIKELVKDDEWQRIRESLLGRWKEHPEWCCSQLRNFLGSISTADNNKIRIVLNYTTGSVFRSKTVVATCVTKLRTQISSEIKKRKDMNEWN